MAQRKRLNKTGMMVGAVLKDQEVTEADGIISITREKQHMKNKGLSIANFIQTVQ